MLVFIFVLLLTVLFSFLPERFIKPQPPKMNIQSIFLQSLLVSSLFLLVTLVVQRSIFSALVVSIFLIILTGVSNAKNRALREPLVFSDIVMFSQAFKHPRLYFPFLGLLPVIIMPLVIIGLIYVVLKLEPAMTLTWQRILSTLITITVCFYLAKTLALKLKLSQNPASDNADYGLLNSLFAYTIQAHSNEHQQQIRQTLQSSPFSLDNVSTALSTVTERSRSTPQNITVIQSESFFDARRLHPSIKHTVLENYDVCKTESIQYGKLNVPAWGANTMRTEFSFLTGLKYQDMGLYRYYPYQYVHKMPIMSLPKLLQTQGYHCICIHPHPASFFRRDRIFPKIGFDEFIDIQHFNQKDTFGPYISDQAVTEKILEVTQKHTIKTPDKPLFIFAITMENHGPLHLEKATPSEQNHYFDKASINESISNKNDLTIYLRHLSNADKMITTLSKAYRQIDKASTLCFYGDHIPSIAKIYQQLDYNDEDSDYFIWSNIDDRDKKQNTTKNTTKNQPLTADTLAKTLLRITGNLNNRRDYG